MNPTAKILRPEQLTFYQTHGYLQVDKLIEQEQVLYYRQVYEDFLNEKIELDGHRSDLSGATNTSEKKERITQIMRPSVLMPTLANQLFHQKALAIARELEGLDMQMDFDMLIDKAPHTNAATPWHQDEAYWLDMPDKRALSCWLALDEVWPENGCMWFVPGSHQRPLRKHVQTGNSEALKCEAQESEAQAVPLHLGSCTFHHGRTLHYSRGNSTDHRRRAFIINFRPEMMIRYERERGYDHLGNRAVKNKSAQ